MSQHILTPSSSRKESPNDMDTSSHKSVHHCYVFCTRFRTIFTILLTQILRSKSDGFEDLMLTPLEVMRSSVHPLDLPRVNSPKPWLLHQEKRTPEISRSASSTPTKSKNQNLLRNGGSFIEQGLRSHTSSSPSRPSTAFARPGTAHLDKEAWVPSSQSFLPHAIPNLSEAIASNVDQWPATRVRKLAPEIFCGPHEHRMSIKLIMHMFDA